MKDGGNMGVLNSKSNTIRSKTGGHKNIERQIKLNTLPVN